MTAVSPAVIAARGAHRIARGHPWVYKSDVTTRPDTPAGVVPVRDGHGRPLGWALWSPRSEIALRLLDRDPHAEIGPAWWRTRIGAALARRHAVARDTTAYRVVYGEADGCPSLICDRYGRWLVVQLLSAGLEACRADIIAALTDAMEPLGILARHDVATRRKEGLVDAVEVLAGTVPAEIEVVEHGVRTQRDGRLTRRPGTGLRPSVRQGPQECCE
jgi:23S rRNA (cytosine1962-C5)-methyltransferase